MATPIEYNWNTEYKNDKRLVDMKEACEHILSIMNKADLLAEIFVKKTAPVVQKSKANSVNKPEKRIRKDDEGSSTADSDYIAHNLQFTNPMEEMSEYESDDAPPPSKPIKRIMKVEEDEEVDEHILVQEENDDDDEEEEESDDEIAAKMCMICGRDENDTQSLVCDGCDDVYHTYCIGLLSVPPGDWFCPGCLAKQYEDFTQTFMGESLETLNRWLYHSCACDARKDYCQNEAFSKVCVFMKRLLRTVAFLSSNGELNNSVMQSKLTRVISHHIATCKEGVYCPVPLCNQLRGRKTVVEICPL
ncbi:hypothetical protein THRCLA_01537 [Thraustotheca clavata]|uniref:PHD-type domain-containing protein n=1 Tax=Thraustotheca clavata TaxID=74557 RepID=A0A1W0A807_9STRA|nr:hypothetical protein THRCLA_01537 [Thraustotheca clavata]